MLVENWKMNGLCVSLKELALIVQAAEEFPNTLEIVVCPPTTLIAQLA